LTKFFICGEVTARQLMRVTLTGLAVAQEFNGANTPSMFGPQHLPSNILPLNLISLSSNSDLFESVLGKRREIKLFPMPNIRMTASRTLHPRLILSPTSVS
jgi:hypothetical protein